MNIKPTTTTRTTAPPSLTANIEQLLTQTKKTTTTDKTHTHLSLHNKSTLHQYLRSFTDQRGSSSSHRFLSLLWTREKKVRWVLARTCPGHWTCSSADLQVLSSPSHSTHWSKAARTSPPPLITEQISFCLCQLLSGCTASIHSRRQSTLYKDKSAVIFSVGCRSLQTHSPPFQLHQKGFCASRTTPLQQQKIFLADWLFLLLSVVVEPLFHMSIFKSAKSPLSIERR